uniref:Uncharacterized protein n=1 Tax=Arundo donax TaxID=35708 RepID=A0A0A9B9T1_ARUDO
MHPRRVSCGEEEAKESSAYMHCFWSYKSTSHSSRMWYFLIQSEEATKGPKCSFLGRSTLASLI